MPPRITVGFKQTPPECHFLASRKQINPSGATLLEVVVMRISLHKQGVKSEKLETIREWFR